MVTLLCRGSGLPLRRSTIYSPGQNLVSTHANIFGDYFAFSHVSKTFYAPLSHCLYACLHTYVCMHLKLLFVCIHIRLHMYGNIYVRLLLIDLVSVSSYV